MAQNKAGLSADLADARRKTKYVTAARVISSATTVSGELGMGPQEADKLEESRDDAFISVPLLLLPGNAHPADKLSILPTLQVKAGSNIR